MPLLFTIARSGNDFSCKTDSDPTFFVGRRVPYENNIGLYNIFSGSRLQKLNYDSHDFTDAFGFWATFIEPTAICEGQNFLTLNTYDRAAFTFGFGQFAAHVPNGDFVQYFRTMLALPEAGDYFPNLSLAGGHISKIGSAGAAIPLESDTTTKPLMDYLNPDLNEVQDAEVIAAAKLIHWTSRFVSARNAQVEQMVATFRDFMTRANRRVGIDGRPANQCCVIADILHQGRGGQMTWPLIDAALKTSKPFDALLRIGLPKWEGRTTKLRNAINARADFQTRRWSATHGEFV